MVRAVHLRRLVDGRPGLVKMRLSHNSWRGLEMKIGTRVTFTTAAICLLAFLSPMARGEVKLSPLFGDHMVLQRDAQVPIWGTADAGEEVTVTVGEKKASATADGSGKWMAKVGPLAAGGPVELSITSNQGSSRSIKDVLVGEVWVCSGQSNMEMSVNSSGNAEQERNSANYPAIRMFTV